MDFNNKDKQLENKVNNEILFHAIQGSQNYELDTENSDVDTKAICLLSFYQTIRKQTVSKKIQWNDESFTDLKDLGEFTSLIRKSNINTLEVLFAKKYSYNKKYEKLIEQLLQNRELIAKINPYRLLKSETGISYSIFKRNKGYKTSTYTKDSYHILRVENFLNNFFINGDSFENSLTNNENKDIILQIKNKEMSPNQANEILIKSMNNIHKLSNEIKKNINKDIDKNIENKINEWTMEIYKQKFKEV